MSLDSCNAGKNEAAAAALPSVQATKDTQALESLVLQLREANQNLVLATFSAQDMQAHAEAANQRQTEFLSMLAHELRNPLAPIAMASELLGKITAAHPQLPKIHGIIDRQVSHMVRLVDDLLDASRVSSGKITLQKVVLALSEIIDSAVETSQPVTDKLHQVVEIDLPADAIAIDGDLVRLAQVFSNLLINASKFSPENERITLSARKLENAVLVSITDRGAGIAADIQPYIFDLFTQGPCSLERSQGGLGIGLSLVRSIVEMHGGQVEVRSNGVGLGSEFRVQLPLSTQPVRHNASHQTETGQAHDRRILLIEDNVDVNETLKLFLEMEGHTVTSVFDGPSGVAEARGDRHDVVICDIGLPGMNGYEVLKKLRMLSLKSKPCFIAMSGYNQAENRTRAMSVGFDHYLVKPVDTDILMALIASTAHR